MSQQDLVGYQNLWEWAKLSSPEPWSFHRGRWCSAGCTWTRPMCGRCAGNSYTLDPGIRGLVSGENDSKLTFEVGDHNPSSSSDFVSEITVMPSCRSDWRCASNMEPPIWGKPPRFVMSLGPKPLEVHMFHVLRCFKAFHHPFHPPIEGQFPLTLLSAKGLAGCRSPVPPAKDEPFTIRWWHRHPK